MKISNSKKQLAQIIHENGGWRDGAESAAQCIKGEISFWHDTATKRRGEDWCGSYLGSCEDIKFTGFKLTNWHQTILSRDEYFHLYPVAEAVPEPVAEARPTIEQLAADYRNRKDYADRKQQEADAAKAEAEAKLAELVAAGKALGLVLGVAAPELGLVVTDWRDLQLGDRIWVGDSGYDNNCPEGEYNIVDRDEGDDDQPVGVMWRGVVQWPQIQNRGWRFVHRPTRGGTNA